MTKVCDGTLLEFLHVEENILKQEQRSHLYEFHLPRYLVESKIKLMQIQLLDLKLLSLISSILEIVPVDRVKKKHIPSHF
jgi:hypothetical protein